MSQAIVRAEDFKTPPGIQQIQGMIYKGEGSPIGQKISPILGAIYIDYISGNIWSCTTINDTSGWQPFYAQVGNSITIDTDVQEGDFVGLLGGGTWANASAALNVARDSAVGDGSDFSAWTAGGKTTMAALSSTETFNGTSWVMSANSLLTAPMSPGTGELFDLCGAGSQMSAWTMGGRTYGTTDVYAFMQIFNGDTWTLGTGSTYTAYGASGGTLYSAWHVLGISMPALVFHTLEGEYYNGSVWIEIPASLSLLFGMAGNKGVGSSNSHVVCGGVQSSVQATSYTYTLHYNGSTYVLDANINSPRTSHHISGTSLNATISGGSNGLGGALSNYWSSSEHYNGCTWMAGNNYSIGVRSYGTAGGHGNRGMVTGGTSNGTNKLSSTEFHTQNVYRKLNFTNAMGAIDISIAFGTSNTSYTASVMSGDIITHRLPYRKFFALNRYLHHPSPFYLESARTVSSITANMDGTATVVLGTSNTEITKGMILAITGSATAANNGNFPVVNFSGGTNITIKNPNAVNQGASGNAALISGNRIVGLPTTTITYTAPNVIFTFDLTGTVSANTLRKLVPMGSIIYVPYAATSGASGSQYNFGSYVVNSVGTNTITCTSIHSQHVTETIACTSVEILNHIISRDVAEAEDYILGFNSRMNLITNTSNDGNFERW